MPLRFRNSMKKLFICILLFVSAQPILATSIVVLITPGYIVIGADSKRMIIDAEKNLVVNQTVCKIRSVNNYCYAAAGFVASASTSYSADSIVQYHLSSQPNVEKALRLIQRDVKKALQKELSYQRNSQPKQYKKTMEMKDHLLEVVVLSMNHQTPQAHVIGFELVNEEKAIIKSYTSKRTGKNAKAENQFYFLGEYSGMEKYLNARQQTSDPIALVNQLIVSQSKITPSSVGAPVALVKYNSDGVEWINNLCRN